MGKKTEILKARLQAEDGELARDALTTINRQQDQINTLLEFASYTHGWVTSHMAGETIDNVQLQPLAARLRSTRNDVKRLADPDDKGCCG